MNPMKTIRIEKVTLNIGCGKDQQKLEKGVELLKQLTDRVPSKTITKKRIQEWGLRPGLPIGCKVTLRKDKAIEVFKRMLDAKEHVLTEAQIDPTGNISFGIDEYIHIPDAKYDPKIGIMGLQVCVTLERPGYRIKRRQHGAAPVHAKHRITRDEAVEYIKKEFKVRIGEAE